MNNIIKIKKKLGNFNLDVNLKLEEVLIAFSVLQAQEKPL